MEYVNPAFSSHSCIYLPLCSIFQDSASTTSKPGIKILLFWIKLFLSSYFCFAYTYMYFRFHRAHPVPEGGFWRGQEPPAIFPPQVWRERRLSGSAVLGQDWLLLVCGQERRWDAWFPDQWHYYVSGLQFRYELNICLIKGHGSCIILWRTWPTHNNYIKIKSSKCYIFRNK